MNKESIDEKFKSSGKHDEKEIEEKEKIQEKEIKTTKKISDKKQHKSNNKKLILILVIIGIVALISIAFSTIFALMNINNSNIISGVKIEGIEFSGLSKEDSREKLKLIYEEKLKKDITIEYDEYSSTINPTAIDTNYDIDGAIDKAYEIGKENNIFINNYKILFALMGTTNINVNMTTNEDDVNTLIDTINSELPEAMEESDYYIEENNLIVTRGKSGIVVNENAFLNKLMNQLKDITNHDSYIEIPVETKEPENIDINKIHDEVYKEVKDAYYTTEPFTIYPEIEGIDFDVEEAKKIVAEDKEEYSIPLTITKPKITIQQIGSEAFPDLIKTYTTKYDASNTDRSTNLRLACEKLNGKVVLPGETFSYNKTLGERTISAGYKNAKVYENGEVVDGIGGGICQISSTLYNTVLMSNLEIVERRNHQFVTSYVPAGRDATVVYGLTDFKFKNTRKYAIKIQAGINNGIATISIYGIKEEDEYTISIEPKVISTIPYTVKYQEDSTLAAGTETVKQKGANGVITETYLVKSLNGVVVSRTLLSKDTYNAMQRIIIRGTKGIKTTQTTHQTSQTTTPIENTEDNNKEIDDSNKENTTQENTSINQVIDDNTNT